VYICPTRAVGRSQIVVVPGRNGAQQPFGQVISKRFRSVTGWTTSRNRNFDYGAILLGSDERLGDTVGSFGWDVRGDAALMGHTVNISGYPGDKPAGTQWFHANAITSVSPSTFTYQIDTAGGQSGAPVWMLHEQPASGGRPPHERRSERRFGYPHQWQRGKQHRRLAS
jgi:V8-like Glu-specific endopeptidase